MEKKIVLKPGYDPDKYRDEIHDMMWKESGAKTHEEFWKYYKERLQKSYEKRKAEKKPNQTFVD